MKMHTVLDAYLDQKQYYHFDGRRGVERLCQLAGDLGYRDPQYFGQLTSTACIGNLVLFLEDNPGAIEAIMDWVRDTSSTEMADTLAGHVDTAALDGDNDDVDDDDPSDSDVAA